MFFDNVKYKIKLCPLDINIKYQSIILKWHECGPLFFKSLLNCVILGYTWLYAIAQQEITNSVPYRTREVTKILQLGKLIAGHSSWWGQW